MALETNQQFLMTPLVSPWNDSKMKNKWRNSILMMCHYPDLGSAFAWSCHKDNVFQPFRSFCRETSDSISKSQLFTKA